MTITQTVQLAVSQMPQPLPVEAAINDVASKLLKSPLIPEEMHEIIRTWEKTVFSYLGTKRAPFAVADIVCRVLWPLLSDGDRQKSRVLIEFQGEVENILHTFFGIKDTEKFIDGYGDILQKTTLVVVKDDGMSMLFEQAHALILRCAQATDDERIDLYQKLQSALSNLSQMRNTMTDKFHAKFDALNDEVTALLHEALNSVHQTECVNQKLLAISIVAGENAKGVIDVAEKVTK